MRYETVLVDGGQLPDGCGAQLLAFSVRDLSANSWQLSKLLRIAVLRDRRFGTDFASPMRRENTKPFIGGRDAHGSCEGWSVASRAPAPESAKIDP